MRVTFIKPHLTDKRSADAMEPLAFAVLKGRTPKEVGVKFFDERLESVPDTIETDLVAISVETFTAKRAYQISNNFRKRGIPVILGGYHATFHYQEALNYADAIVMGEAEDLWPEVIRDSQAGQMKRIYSLPTKPSLKKVVYDRSIFRNKKYKMITPIQYGRGCPFTCDFCSIHAFYGTDTRQRTINEIVSEIESLNSKYFLFVDDNLFINPKRTEKLLKALIPLNISWVCQISINITRNTKLLNLMAKSGCIGVLIGFESLDEKSLDQISKGWNLEKGGYDTAIQKFHDRNIMIYASFMFGLDNDTTDTFDKTVEFAIESKFALANFSEVTPMPGSRLYSDLEKQNRLVYEKWWLDPAYRYGDATFIPLQMTPDDLKEGCLRARKQFFGYGSILERLLNTSANNHSLKHFSGYISANLITKRELFYKLGQPLGNSDELDVDTGKLHIAL